ncbi:MAG: hypothetical protein ABWZ40_13030 [Caulobacterales bacterium]
MVAKRGSGNDRLRSALEALLIELEAAAKGNAGFEDAGIESRAKVLASLSKAAESLFALLHQQQKREEEAGAGRSAEDAAARYRDGEIWREIERRLARLRAAEAATQDHKTAW